MSEESIEVIELSSVKYLPCSIRDHPIIPKAQQAFPSGNGEGHDALKLVVPGLVGHIHSAREQRKAAS